MFLAKRTCKNDAACVHHKLRTRPAQAILVAYAHAPCAGHSLHHLLKVFGGQRIQGAVGMATRMQVARIMV